MGFARSEMAFQPGLFANRSRRASKLRWVDGNLVRFRDGTPAQVGGWQAIHRGPAPSLASSVRCSRTSRTAKRNGLWRSAASKAHYLFDGDIVEDITPSPFTPGIGSSLPTTGYGTALYGADDLWHAARRIHEQPDRRLELVVRHVRRSAARALQLRRQALQVRPHRRRRSLPLRGRLSDGPRDLHVRRAPLLHVRLRRHPGARPLVGPRRLHDLGVARDEPGRIL
jgi:hypothetical protein